MPLVQDFKAGLEGTAGGDTVAYTRCGLLTHVNVRIGDDRRDMTYDDAGAGEKLAETGARDGGERALEE